MLDVFIKSIFWAVLPAILIYFRLKKKIDTKFTLAFIIFSFILSFLIISTIRVSQDNLLKDLKLALLNNNFEEIKKNYQIIVQAGPEKIAAVDKQDLFKGRLDLYQKIKRTCGQEYLQIAREYYQKKRIEDSNNCLDLTKEINNLGYLKHALRLLDYANLIGAEDKNLREKLNDKIEIGIKLIAEIEEKCK